MSESLVKSQGALGQHDGSLGEGILPCGEALFLAVALSDKFEDRLREMNETDLTELSRYIQGHAVDKNEGVAGMIYTYVITVFGMRAVGELGQPMAEGSEKLEVRSEKCLDDGTQDGVLDRASAFDASLSKSLVKGHGSGSQQNEAQHDEARCGEKIFGLVTAAGDYRAAIAGLDDVGLNRLSRYLGVARIGSSVGNTIRKMLSEEVELRFFRTLEMGGQLK